LHFGRLKILHGHYDQDGVVYEGVHLFRAKSMKVTINVENFHFLYF